MKATTRQITNTDKPPKNKAAPTLSPLIDSHRPFHLLGRLRAQAASCLDQTPMAGVPGSFTLFLDDFLTGRAGSRPCPARRQVGPLLTGWILTIVATPEHFRSCIGSRQDTTAETGPAGKTAERAHPIRLMKQGFNNSEACRIVDGVVPFPVGVAARAGDGLDRPGVNPEDGLASVVHEDMPVISGRWSGPAVAEADEFPVGGGGSEPHFEAENLLGPARRVGVEM
jgi:hypothetical protein